MLLKAVLSFAVVFAVFALSAAQKQKLPLAKLENGGVHWALLIAGSNGFYNYRHQADICHAYQILHKNGIPDERIVVMMYDDIANNEENIHKGVIINHPKGKDVYKGVPKDYVGENVDPDIFLNVLQGKKKALNGRGSGKVINSGPNDNVFVFFSDHGAPGLIAFPNAVLHASALIGALESMHKEKKYKEMVLYIEACESGSMFKKLPKNINIFATTASNGKESSYACYYDEELGTYLGDVYSVCWMEDSDKAKISSETLQQQFKIVKKETNTSHVIEFGDLSISKMTLGTFQGGKQSKEPAREIDIKESEPRFDSSNSVDSREVILSILQHKLRTAKTVAAKEAATVALLTEYQTRHSIRQTFEYIVTNSTLNVEQQKRILITTYLPNLNGCYEEAVDHFFYSCVEFKGHDFILGQFRMLANLCYEEIDISAITTAIDHVCGIELETYREILH